MHSYLEVWPGGYKTFFMLDSTEHEISTAHKTKMQEKIGISCSHLMYLSCNCWHFNIYEQYKFHTQLS